ncbi:putative homeobox domain-containing protein [Golovinomyces cichoracearum]|uniref:Putative homeobox domain-containing protein n=1 Tax=Golovinomyces cichoracearum TaxID=62708 RepID=A0A420IY66_9PEZI|nr:putative homeobox domain-containing protein [Golovinomyces cichoracearum]
MEYFASSFPLHQKQHSTSLNSGNIHSYVVPALYTPMMTIAQTSKTIEAKPRLGKDEVNILEQEFRKNPKPSTLTKKAFAEEMNVDLPRINNWFQNRRAKRKQEKKLKENEAAQVNKNPMYSSLSPDETPHANSKHSDNNQLIVEKMLSVNRPQLTEISYNPELTIISSTESNSFQPMRHISTDDHASHDAYFLHPLDCNQVSALTSGTHITTGHLNNLPFNCSSRIDDLDVQKTNQKSPDSMCNQMSMGSSPHLTYSFNDKLRSFDPVSKQILQGNEPMMLLSPKSSHGQAKEDSYLDNANSDLSNERSDIDFHQNTDNCHITACDPDYQLETLGPPPGPNNISFRSRPMNIASRRKKVRHRPAALVSGTLGLQPRSGPSTVSYSEGFNISIKSPVDLPMRKIVSAGGNRVVVSGRVQKPVFDMAQKSPLNIGSFENVGSFMDHNLHNIYNAPPLTGLSSICSSLPPSTPNDLKFAHSDEAMSAASNGDRNFVYNLNVSNCYVSLDQINQNINSSEITQPIPLVQNKMHSWSNGLDYNEKICLFDTIDDPQSLNYQDTFNFDSQFHEPFIINSSSQPTTPAFNPQYNQCLSGYLSPHNECKSIPNQYTNGYTFTNTTCDPGKSLRQKIEPIKLQFSNTTSADYTEK